MIDYILYGQQMRIVPGTRTNNTLCDSPSRYSAIVDCYI